MTIALILPITTVLLKAVVLKFVIVKPVAPEDC